MKIARLPTGKILKFPPETPDDAIDHAVKAHMKDHIAEKQRNKEKEEHSEATLAQRHNELVQALAMLVHSHHNMLTHAIEGHKQIMEGLNGIIKAHNTPKKRRPIRDKNNKLIGVEEYV